MDNYIVSARKYRPQSFDSVVGQHALTTTLRNAIASGKLAHAYLFCGPRGVGKTTCARIFAKAINCLTPHEGEACGACESCRAFSEGRSLNIFELDAASNNSVEDIRQIIEQVNIPPQLGRYKVFIIDEVHMLSQAAFNAFLKTLEEPPAHVIFILATTEKHKVLPTILSRCQIYDFNRMGVADIVGHLRHVALSEGIQADDAALAVIAQKADGGMRDALSIFDQVNNFSEGNITYQKVIEDLNVLDYDYYFRVTEQLLEGRVADVMLTFNEIVSKGFEANHFIGGLAAHFRDLLVARADATLPLLEVGDDVRDRYRQQASLCKPKFLYRALKLCNDCDINYRVSRNKRLLVELTLIEVAQASDEEPAAGLCPTKTLKPLFQNLPPAAPGAAVSRPEASAAASVAPAPAQAPQTSAKPAPARPDGAVTPAAAPRPAMGHRRTFSLRQPAASAAEAPAAAVEAPASYGNAPFTETDVQLAWTAYAQRLPDAEAALQGRMRNLTPTLAADGSVDVPVENDMVLADYQRMRSAIEDSLRRTLRNDSVRLSLRLMERSAQVRPYSRKEQLADMLERSRPFAQLYENLKLELA